MYSRTFIAVLLATVVMAISVSADDFVSSPTNTNTSLSIVSHSRRSCPTFCWLRTGDQRRKIAQAKCGGHQWKYLKTCTRNGKKGFTCRCRNTDKPDQKPESPKPESTNQPDSPEQPGYPQMCGKAYLSPLGSSKFSARMIDMGSSSGFFELQWAFYSLMDKMTIFQGGSKIFSTDTPIKGFGKAKVLLNGKSSRVRIVVNSPNPASLWDFYPTCPF